MWVTCNPILGHLESVGAAGQQSACDNTESPEMDEVVGYLCVVEGRRGRTVLKGLFFIAAPIAAPVSRR